MKYESWFDWLLLSLVVLGMIALVGVIVSLVFTTIHPATTDPANMDYGSIADTHVCIQAGE